MRWRRRTASVQRFVKVGEECARAKILGVK
jgi:hypothetical protein